MPVDAATLRRELVRLRKGRALRDPEVMTKLGPATRRAFHIEEGDSAAVARRKVRAEISRHLRLDMRLPALAALGLHPEASQRLLADRVAWLAARLFCNDRTARRRVDSALSQLIDACIEAEHDREFPGPRDDDGYAMRRLGATMRLDTAGPELHETRSIVVTSPRLETIVLRLTIPHSAGGVGAGEIVAQPLFGGRIGPPRSRSQQHLEFDFHFPRPLGYGDTHDYGFVYRLPPGFRIRPHCVFNPLVACERFDLTVHFGCVPWEIWRVDGVIPRVLDEPPTGPGDLRPDRSGVLRLAFTELRQGFAYGARWRPCD